MPPSFATPLASQKKSIAIKKLLFAKPLGIKQVALCQPDPNRPRSCQGMNMMFQPVWNPIYSEIADSVRKAKCKTLAEKSPKGYAMPDWAFQLSADGNMQLTNTLVNAPNTGSTAWQSTAGPALANTQWQESPAAAAKLLKAMAGFYGAQDSGICQLQRSYVYSHYFDMTDKKPYPIVFSDQAGYESYTTPQLLPDKTQVIPAHMTYTLVMVFEMDSLAINAAPLLAAQAATKASYAKMAFAVQALAQFIRGLGYQAIPSLNDTALNIPLAVDAGLGQYSRNAKLIHPIFGSRCRIAKVVTNLPLALDSPIDFGVDKFCSTCNICAQHCPSGAIPTGGKSAIPKGDYSLDGINTWQLEHDKCRGYWAKTGTNCGLCIKHCPYNSSKAAGRWLMASAAAVLPGLNRLVLRYAKSRLAPNKNNIWEEIIR